MCYFKLAYDDYGEVTLTQLPHTLLAKTLVDEEIVLTYIQNKISLASCAMNNKNAIPCNLTFLDNRCICKEASFKRDLVYDSYDERLMCLMSYTHMELHPAPATERQWVNCGFSSCFITTWHSTSRKLVQLQGQGEKSPALCFVHKCTAK